MIQGNELFRPCPPFWRMYKAEGCSHLPLCCTVCFFEAEVVELCYQWDQIYTRTENDLERKQNTESEFGKDEYVSEGNDLLITSVGLKRSQYVMRKIDA